MKIKIVGNRLFYFFLMMLLFSSFQIAQAQIEDLEEEGDEETIKCKPDSFTTVYEKFKADTINQQKIAIWYSLGQEEYKYKNYKRAIPYFWKILLNDKTGKFRVVYSKLADSYFHQNHVDSTLLIVYLGLQKYPDYASLHYWGGFVHDRLGHVQCAIPHYEALVKSDPENKSYWEKLAFLYYKAEDPRAIEAQQRVVELDPQNVEATRLLAEIMTYFGEDPIKALKDAYEKDPNNLESAFHYGKAAYEAGSYEEALKPFHSVLKIDPKHTQALEYIGRCYEALNRLSEAIRTYKKILKLEPKNTKVMCLIASTYARINNFSSARFYVNKAKQLDPGYGLPYMVMAEVYENAVNYCSNRRAKKQFTYDDKLIYRLAANEYKKAARDPNFKADARKRMKQLETLVPTKEDLFMHKNRLKPKDSCYAWIK